jgi:hypothetical protein
MIDYMLFDPPQVAAYFTPEGIGFSNEWAETKSPEDDGGDYGEVGGGCSSFKHRARENGMCRFVGRLLCENLQWTRVFIVSGCHREFREGRARRGGIKSKSKKMHRSSCAAAIVVALLIGIR